MFVGTKIDIKMTARKLSVIVDNNSRHLVLMLYQ